MSDCRGVGLINAYHQLEGLLIQKSDNATFSKCSNHVLRCGGASEAIDYADHLASLSVETRVNLDVRLLPFLIGEYAKIAWLELVACVGRKHHTDDVLRLTHLQEGRALVASESIEQKQSGPIVFVLESAPANLRQKDLLPPQSKQCCRDGRFPFVEKVRQ